MNRPGATQCASCHAVTPYVDLLSARVKGRKRKSFLCAGCFDRLGRIGLLA